MGNVKSKFVLYLDIMGFKERVTKVEISELEEQLKAFKTKNKKLKPLLEKSNTNPKETLINMAQFSDSIVLVTVGDTLDDLNRICKAAVILMRTGLETGFALRGAMAKGEMIFDKENQLFFGKALVDAYLLEEELCYYGIVFHESMEEKVIKIEESPDFCMVNVDDTTRKTYIPIEDIDIPLKKGKSKHYHIAWHKMNKKLEKGNMSKEAIEWLRNMRKTVSGNPRVYLDNTIKMINDDKEK
ncbi:MAG: hypothetical protein U0L65_00915 [Bacteroidales bacterium]|nr:hypothetical protein [Bacteroidales bacterium]